MSVFKKCILSMAVALVATALPAQRPQYGFRTIDGNSGLSANNVKSIARDKLGFMWFGTKNGLNRYDGSDIKTYTCIDKELKRGNNNIGALYVAEDSVMWIGTDRGIYKYDPKRDKISYSNLKTKSGSAPDNWVQRISGDGKGNVWAVLPDQGVYRIHDGQTDVYLPIGPRSMKRVYPSDLCVTRDGNVWVTTTGNGIMKFDANANRFIHVNSRTPGNADAGANSLCCICEGERGILYVGTTDGRLFKFDPMQDTLEPMPAFETGNVYLRCIESFGHELWIGTQTGLYVMDTLTGQTVALKENPINRFSIPDNAIYTIYHDNEGGAWVGSMFGGVSYMSRRKFGFTSYGLSDGLSSRLVLGLASDAAGNVWIGTETGGVNVLNPFTGRIVGLNSSDPTVIFMTAIAGNIFTGYARSGLFQYSPGNSGLLRFPQEEGQGKDVYSYLVDSKGNEWVGLGFALYRKKKGEERFSHVEDTKYDWIYCMKETSDGTIWIGTMGNGVWRYDPRSDKFRLYDFKENAKKPSGLFSNSINSIMEDSSGTVWISTDRGGLSRYNPSTDDFTTFGMSSGFPDNVVYSVLEDKKKNLWFGTNHGLVRFTPSSGKVITFSESDGLPSDQFNYKSAIKTADGQFYMGSVNGVVAFRPDDLDEALSDSVPLYFTNLKVPGNNDEDIESIAGGNIIFSDKITLDHDQATFTLSVASPDFKHPGNVRFSYRLLPINEEWVDMNGHEISFNNLAAGKYDLEVKADNGFSTNVRKIRIRVLPPWWLSGWAILFYALLFMSMVASGVYIWYLRNARKIKQRESNFLDNQERELYLSKVAFFTEIAHEIRTPLSLIDLPLEAIEEMGSDNPDITRYVKVSRQNTKRLLELTGQLLDFQKIDTNRLTLKSENVNVTELVKGMAERFEPSISLIGKHLKCDIDQAPLEVSVDKEALTKIVSNLLNNARKYAVDKIELTLRRVHAADGDKYVISVSSDGEKIAVKDRSRIFQAFYQTGSASADHNGVGIGLPLSRSLAKLLGGKLELEENTGDLNVFTLTLPVTEPLATDPGMANDIDEYVVEQGSNQAKDRSDIFSVLLVEDNDGISNFVAEQLRSSFIVETASNGVEALDMLSKSQFDIIVTDIMMPGMDGLELCAAVKQNIDTSHIPVVFITAKNDVDTKVKGLQLGGEAYVEKPFSIKYLKQLIKSLLENRRRSREAFQKNPFFTVDNMQMNKADEEFMNKVRKVIIDNVSDDNLNVEMLCDKLAMSRSSLLRKIKTLFNLTPAELIRVIKLKKAAELIQQGEYRIGDIGYMVGIASPSYFSKIFAKQFGMTPKDFEKQSKSQSQNSQNRSEQKL